VRKEKEWKKSPLSAFQAIQVTSTCLGLRGGPGGEALIGIYWLEGVYFTNILQAAFSCKSVTYT